MRFVKIMSALFFAVFVLCACSASRDTDLSFSDNAMGVPFEIFASGDDVDPGDFRLLCLEAFERVKNVERATDPNDPVSDVCRFNSSDWGIDDAGDVLQTLLSEGLYACDLTNGGYDPTLGALTDLWDRSRATGAPQEVRIEVALSHCGQELVGISGPNVTKADDKLMLDLGSIREGFAAQKALICLDNSALESGSVTLGNTVGFFAGAEDAEFEYSARDQKGREFAKVKVGAGFVSRVTVDYDLTTGVSSVIDPATGAAVHNDVKCVAVRSPDGAMSAATAYALASLSSKRAIELWRKCGFEFDALILLEDATVYATGSFAADDAVEITLDEYHLIRIKDK